MKKVFFMGFWHFLKVASLVFLDIAEDCSLGQCLTFSRAETSEIFENHFGAQTGAKMIFSILMSWSIHLNLLVVFKPTVVTKALISGIFYQHLQFFF